MRCRVNREKEFQDMAPVGFRLLILDSSFVFVGNEHCAEMSSSRDVYVLGFACKSDGDISRGLQIHKLSKLRSHQRDYKVVKSISFPDSSFQTRVVCKRVGSTNDPI